LDTCILRMDTYFEGRLLLGAWLDKWIWLLSMSCFIAFPLQVLVIIFSVLIWPPFPHTCAYLYVPNPLRCYQCQRFGRGKNSCQRPAVCARCGGRDHQESVCHADPHCVNCGGDHTRYSKDCSEWARQKDITKIKFERNISFGEAKQIVDRQAVPGVTSTVHTGILYAKATVSATTQTTQSVEILQKMPYSCQCLIWQLNRI